MAVRPRSRWSDRSSTAWIAYSPLAEMRTLAHPHRSAHPAALEQAGDVAREVRDDDVGARAADGGERFHHRALLVQPAELARGLDHRVFTGHRVGGQRDAELGLGPRDDVEVR